MKQKKRDLFIFELVIYLLGILFLPVAIILWFCNKKDFRTNFYIIPANIVIFFIVFYMWVLNEE